MIKDKKLRAILEVPTPRTSHAMSAEFVDFAWAAYGHRVHDRLANTAELAAVLNQAFLKTQSSREIAALLRLYLHTGVKP